jgi:hypothetical protein
MNEAFDVIIVGSGPAGVSAAFPLLAAGCRVLLVDGGREARLALPSGQYLTQRAADPEQWHWMLGKDYHALQHSAATSPKLRAPTLAHVFENFSTANHIAARDFTAVGSLAQGGLSNAWGCGVAALSPDELAAFPFPPAELAASYQTIARRIGISGNDEDDMSVYFGLDAWAQPGVGMDKLHAHLFARYMARRDGLQTAGFRLGRSRLAVLTRDQDGRRACDLSGSCLWGCERGAMYSATADLAVLKQHPQFRHLPGHLVQEIGSDGALRTIAGTDRDGNAFRFGARKLVLAAGTLATTRLALRALDHRAPVPLQSSPTAAFLLWVPRLLGLTREPCFGLGQLAFALRLDADVTGFGSLLSTIGLPVAEFTPYVPLGKRQAIDVLSVLLSSCAVGNVFLPGHLTRNSMRMDAAGTLHVEGGYKPEAAMWLAEAGRKLRRIFGKLGAMMLPGSFVSGSPGSDIHYAASLPMRKSPGPGETSMTGELFGLNGIHIVDGACLSFLSEKSHTLTIMANADRIGRTIKTTL